MSGRTRAKQESAPAAVGDPRARFTWPEAQFAINDVRQIIDPAADLFAERGFENTTMDDLAQRIGVSKPTLYAYVGSKSRILEAIYDHFLQLGDRFMAEAAELETAPEQLRSIVRNWTWASVEMRSYYVVYFHQRTSLEPAAREAVREAASKMVRVIRDVVIEGQRKGEIASDVDPTFMTFSVVALSTWPGQWLHPHSEADRAGLGWEQAAEQAYRMLERGIVTGEPGAAPAPKRRRS